MPPRPLVVVAGVFGVLSAACCFPSSEEMGKVRERQEARAAGAEARRAKVGEHRGHLRAIAQKVAALTEVAPAPCDARRVAALRVGPPEGVDDTFWSYPWVAEAEWLVAAGAGVGADGEPAASLPPDPRFASQVSVEARSVFRSLSKDPGYRENDLDNRGEIIEQRPALLAVIHPRRVQDPVVEFAGVAFVPGSFQSGAYVADLTLWDIAAEELLCATRVEAVSSSEVELGTVFRDSPREAAQKDFEERIRAALNASAAELAPGLRVQI